ncbi:MAG: DUF401 family protein [Planctomycetes bacterium]|nr:DUF401 family protein [Planctomycetota bacterium]
MAALLALSVSLALVLAAPRLRLASAAAFLLGAAFLAVGSTAGSAQGFLALASCLAAPRTLSFVVAVLGVFVLSAQLQECGALRQLTLAANRSLRNPRLRIAALPALIGLLPMPGGAMVSAPMVEQCGHGDKHTQHLINYWFRHIWEIWWPLYPPVLLAADFSGCSVSDLALVLAPLMLVLVLAGAWWFLRSIPAASDDGVHSGGSISNVILPLALVLLCMPLAERWLSTLGVEGSEWALALATLPGMAFLMFQFGASFWWRALTSRRIWGLVFVAWTVKVFGTMVSASGAAISLADLVSSSGSMAFGLLVVPLIAGLATGNTVAAVCIAFPLVAALPGMQALEGRERVLLFAVAYAAAFLGYMLSPVHMCLVLSARHFGSPLLLAWRRLAAPLLLCVLLGAGYFLALLALQKGPADG